MREKVSLINARNCRSKRLEIVPDFPSTGETKSLGTFDGVIYKVERRKVRSRSYYRIWVRLTLGGKKRRLYQVVSNLTRLTKELERFGMAADAIDVSQGLDCSGLIGRAVKAEIELLCGVDGKKSHWITEIDPLP